ncbi:MAG: DUF502 domain-containing protein [Candidatus Omnitrophica bacterium]|nr:DUF502 domain-containing protein [Candidatus Omnitrophota bacterium]MCM8806650.1 DUF502 domain-containing protein [Candidatus Omnitrophota bacterium]
MKTIKKHFISGIIFIVPVALSVWVIFKIFIFLENILGNFFKKFFPNIYIPGVGLISLIFLIFIIGFLANNFFGKKLLEFIEMFFENIPFLNKIFNFVKNLVKRITEKKTDVFKGVVKIKMPDDSYTIGFLTGEFEEGYFSVFIPTVPNITTGIVLMVPKNKIEKLNIPVEEAIKIVISMGLFTPSNASNKN